MRIALVVERFEPAGGGVEHAVWMTAEALAEAGDEVEVFARRAEPHPAVRVHRLAAPRFWQPLRVALFASRAERALRAARAAKRYDVTHSFCRVPGADCFHAGGGSHAHYMARTYGVAGARWRRGTPRHALQLDLERRVFARRPWLQCVSQRAGRELAERYAVPSERTRFIPYGVDPERFRPAEAAERRQLRSAFGAAKETVWLFAGSGWRRKGLDTALRALAASRDRDAQLWIAGRDATPAWEQRAAAIGVGERVRFLGPRDDLEQVYRASDGLLLPTRYDAFGMVCLEAAASGLPVVTSAAAGASELLGDVARVVDDAEDAAGFANALDALADPAERERLGAGARQVAEAHSWRAQTDRLRALYADIRDARSDV